MTIYNCQAISKEALCYSLLGRQNNKFLKFCNNYPGAVATLLSVASFATDTCKQQLRYDIWGCYGINEEIMYYGKRKLQGNRETAYLYALSSAAFVYKLFQDCSKGLISECLCDLNAQYGKNGKKCLSNIDWSLKITRTFTDLFELKSKSPNARTLMNLHNNQLGRKIASKYMKRICKCHGTSGSCTYQTCWNTIDSFENIGFELLQLYRNATHVFKSNKDKARLKAKTRTKSLSQQLVYLQSSDNYCLRKNLNLDHGTRGRECKIGVPRDDPGHCNNLCCGRGSIMNVTKIDANCNCEYDWCCTMSCEKCFINRYKYYCK